MKLDELSWELVDMVDGEVQLDSNTSIMEDMESFKSKLVEGDYGNINKLVEFTKGCIKKYGEDKTKYYFKFLFKRYFGYK